MDQTTLADAFNANVLKDRQCHYWDGSKNEEGVPVLHHDGQTILAAHIAFYLDRTYWPRTQPIHLCGDPECVRSFHLWFTELGIF